MLTQILICSFLCIFVCLSTIVCHFYNFLLTILLSVLLWFTTSDYPIGAKKKRCNFRLLLHIFFYRHLSHAPVNYFMIIFSVVRRWEKFLICNSPSRCNNTNIFMLLVKIGKEYLCSMENSHPTYIHIFQDLHLFGQYYCMKTFIGCEIWN